MEAGSDAAWFAAGGRDGLCHALDGGDERPAAEILGDMVEALRREYEARAAELGVEIPPDAPSVSLALFREIGGQVEFFGLGDCVGVAELADGSLVWSRDKDQPVLDDGVIRHMAEIHRKNGVSVREAPKQCNDLLLKNRLLRNRPGGYWILDPHRGEPAQGPGPPLAAERGEGGVRLFRAGGYVWALS